MGIVAFLKDFVVQNQTLILVLTVTSLVWAFSYMVMMSTWIGGGSTEEISGRAEYGIRTRKLIRIWDSEEDAKINDISATTFLISSPTLLIVLVIFIWRLTAMVFG